MKHKLIVITISLFSLQPLFAQQSRTLTLKEAIDLSIANSKQLKINEAKILEASASIKEAEEKVIAAMKPGVTVADLEKVGKDVYIKHGLEKLWPDYIGHFVGMAVHDVGPYDKPFVEGVVFNVEPIIEDKELKVHLRLEDTIVITKTGAENLTAGTTVEPEQIYKLKKEKGVGEKAAF